MILLILSIILCTTFAESLDEGNSCNFTNGTPGICTRLNNCQPVIQGLIVGNTPDKICGYSGFEPIVCCPPRTSLSKNVTDDGRGAISRQKCAEYSQYVYTLKPSPILSGEQRLVNVSECASAAQNLIISGPKALPKEFPHMAAVGFQLNDTYIGWYCDGSLISETFVLTAAHCIHSRSWGEATWVRVGVSNLDQTYDGTPVDRRIIERIKHPDYKRPAVYNDIALLRLETRVPFNSWIRPSCLHTAPSVETPYALATGWGRINWADDDESSNDLMKVRLALMDQQTCNASWNSGIVDIRQPSGVVGNWSICASAEGKDICQGNSGGPLAILSQKEFCMYDIIGVTSFPKLCGRNDAPGIYTRVYYYLPWIESIVWGNE